MKKKNILSGPAQKMGERSELEIVCFFSCICFQVEKAQHVSSDLMLK